MYINVNRSVDGRLVDSGEPDLEPYFSGKLLEPRELRVFYPQSFACSPELRILRSWPFRHSWWLSEGRESRDGSLTKELLPPDINKCMHASVFLLHT